MKTIDVKGRPYVEVNERLKYFREHFKNWSLTSEIISLANGVVVIKAIISDDTGTVKATGLAYEKEGSTFINKTSYIENCETSAWGRALGNLGIGIDTSIASADEVQNAVLNQNKPEKKTVTKNSIDTNDADIYVALAKIDDIETIHSFYETNIGNVNDPKAFNEMANARIRAIKEIKAKFENKPTTDIF